MDALDEVREDGDEVPGEDRNGEDDEASSARPPAKPGAAFRRRVPRHGHHAVTFSRL